MYKIKKKRAQFAIEFAVLIAFMFLMFVGFIAVISNKLGEAKEIEKERIAEDIADLAINEIEFAKTVTNGYSRTFQLPRNIGGESYSIEILNNREIVVSYLDKEFVGFLPEKVCGDLYTPDNDIDKIGGVICVNANLDETQCQNAETLNLCDGLEEDVIPGVKCCCCSRFGLCCPQCNDGLDNDLDLFTDFPSDTECASENDDDESQ